MGKNLKTIIVAILIGAVAVGAFFYWRFREVHGPSQAGGLESPLNAGDAAASDTRQDIPAPTIQLLQHLVPAAGTASTRPFDGKANRALVAFVNSQKNYGVEIDLANLTLPLQSTVYRENDKILVAVRALMIDEGTYNAALPLPGKAAFDFWLSMIPAGGGGSVEFSVHVGDTLVFRQELTGSSFRVWRHYSVDLAPFSDSRATISIDIRQKRAQPGPGANNILLLGDPVLFSRETQPSPPAHVILWVVDSLRADRLGVYGYSRPTSPEIDAFDAEAFRFEKAYSQSNNTGPSVTSLFTSRYPSAAVPFLEDTVTVSPPLRAQLPAGTYTVFDAFQENGYRTAFFTANEAPLYAQGAHGVDLYFFAKQDSRKDPRRYHASTGALLPAIFDFLEAHKNQKVFLYVHTMDTHSPYAPPEPYFSFFWPGKDSSPVADLAVFQDLFFQPLPFTDITRTYLNALYDGTVLYSSHQFGQLVTWLKRQNLYASTTLALTADHGEQIDEHGHFGHAKLLFDEEIHVPLLIKLATDWQPEGGTRVVGERVELMDLYPTLADLLGLKAPEHVGFWGVSLLPLMQQARKEYRKEFIFSQNQWNLDKMILQGRYKYIVKGLRLEAIADRKVPFWENPACKEEIYDQAADPLEKENLIDAFGERPELAQFRETMGRVGADIQTFNSHKPAATSRNPNPPYTPEDLKRLKSLGYIR
ncbi:MAG: sulfatase [Acidobacteria bacterium]|nr:sulfatase [Acidobacteriota bacterium]